MLVAIPDPFWKFCLMIAPHIQTGEIACKQSSRFCHIMFGSEKVPDMISLWYGTLKT